MLVERSSFEFVSYVIKIDDKEQSGSCFVGGNS